MPYDDPTYLNVSGKPLRYAANRPRIIPWAMANKTVGYFLLNQDTGISETAEKALDRAGKNRAPGANQAPAARRFILDSPSLRRVSTPSANFWRGKNGSNGNTPMQTDLVDIADGDGKATNSYVIYMVVAMHKADAALLNSGADAANNHAQIIGSYGNTIYGGWGIEFFRPTGFRLITYDITLGIRTVNLGIPGTETDADVGNGVAGPWVEADLKCDLIRLIRLDVLPDKIMATNLSGDSPSSNTAQVTTPNGRRASMQPISILGRVAPQSTTNYLLGASAMLFDIKSDVPTTPEHNLIAAQCREQMRIAGVTELASIG